MSMKVQSLRQLCLNCISHHIIGHGSGNLNYRKQQGHLLSQLDQGAWGSDCKLILENLVTTHRHYITPRVVSALLSDTVTDLSFKDCPLLDAACLNQAMLRCHHLEHLSLVNLPVDVSMLYIFGSHCAFSFSFLYDVILDECPQVKDIDIQNLLRNVPSLKHLSLASCEITNDVFLLDEDWQLGRHKTEFQTLKSKQKKERVACCLESVNLSRCGKFNSIGVQHLYSLCGPTLRAVNLAFTPIDCTAFLYLSGLDLLQVVEFFVSCGIAVGNVMDRLLDCLRRYNKICMKWEAEKMEEDEESVSSSSEADVKDSHLDTKQTLGEEENTELLITSSYTENVLMLKQDCNGNTSQREDNLEESLTVEGLSLTEKDSDKDESLIEKKRADSYGESDSINCSRFASSSNSDGANGDSAKCVQNSQECNVDVTTQCVYDQTNNCESDSGISCPNQNDGQSSPTPSLEEASLKQSKSITQTPPGGRTEQLLDTNGDSTKPTKLDINGKDEEDVVPRIEKITMSARVFREKDIGLRCLQKFLMTNDLVSLNLYSEVGMNLVTDEVIDLVSTYSPNLTSLTVESCDLLTDTPFQKIAEMYRGKLREINLTGVSFLKDRGIMPLVTDMPLTRLKLAETMVTGRCLNRMADFSLARKLQEIDLSWCEGIGGDSGIARLVCSCDNLKILLLRKCSVSERALIKMAENLHSLEHLSLNSNMFSAGTDEAITLMSYHFHSLCNLDLAWNGCITDIGIKALLMNCPTLQILNLEGLRSITAKPFIPMISVPVELHLYLHQAWKTYINERTDEKEKLVIDMTFSPCIPHRSFNYAHRLQWVSFRYCDFVDDDFLKQLVTVSHGGIEVFDYYGEIVQPLFNGMNQVIRDHLEIINAQR